MPNGAIPSQSNCLYRNNGIANNTWINIKCVGTISNVSAIGARVKAKSTINGTDVWQVREIFGQTGFNAQNSFNVEFGLGDALVVDSLIIRWPSGLVENYWNIEVNKFYEATETQGISVILSLKNNNATGFPLQFELFQNYPNPFNPITVISWQLPVSSKVELELFNLWGQKITTLLSASLLSGSHSVQWTAEGLPSGVYLYRIEAGDFVQTRKMLLLK